MKNKKGFTLTEVLVVIVIMGIVLGLSIPSIIAIRRRVNVRLFDEKKKTILVSAELYGKDRSITGDTLITVEDLLEIGYVLPDVKAGEGICTDSRYTNGCVVDPVTNEIINDKQILLKASSFSVIAVWDGSLSSSTSDYLVDLVKEKLNCPSTISASNPCVFDSDAEDNYIYMSGIMWRIIGVYNIDSVEAVKLVTDDTIVWEED